MRRLLIAIAAVALLACATGTRANTPLATPESAAAELLEADRAFSRASADTDLVTGLSRMFDARIFLNARGRMWRGTAEATEALRGTPDAATSRARWTPVRAGVSADGTHGFTFGYMTVTKADGTTLPLKYLSYWMRGADGWRVVAYRRGLRPAGTVAPELPPALPARMVSPTRDSASLRALAASVADAERAFSNDAQVMGIGPAFAKWGTEDAVNMGGPNDTLFVRGSQNIGNAVAAGGSEGVTVVWGSEDVLVASSGDLGVSIGTIVVTQAGASGAAPTVQRVPFFTVWRRADAKGVWRYVAE